jgi:NADH-quinone oxidoreductase subunit K
MVPGSIPLWWYLAVSAVLFGIGIFAVTSRHNAISILIGVELILNSASINFTAFSHYMAPPLGFHSPPLGQVVSLFIIVLAAAEAAIALAIIMSIFINFRTIDVDETVQLQK